MTTMADQSGGASAAIRAVPVASFNRYAGVERAMEALAAAQVPANRTAVIGRGFHRNGHSGWLGTGRAAVIGGFGIAWAGGMLAVFVAAIGDTPPERMGNLLLWGILLGGIVGGLSAAATQMVIASHTEPGAATRYVADRYDLYADPAVADRVARIVTDRPLRTARARAPYM
jgi:hypothetical protein